MLPEAGLQREYLVAGMAVAVALDRDAQLSDLPGIQHVLVWRFAY